MRFDEMIYFSRSRLRAFSPARPFTRVPTVNVEVDLKVASIGFGPAAPRDPTDVEVEKLHQVRKQLEREAAHFYAPPRSRRLDLLRPRDGLGNLTQRQ